jgi:hypothetical protein
MKLMRSYVTKKSFSEAMEMINNKINYNKYTKILLVLLMYWFVILFCIFSLIVVIKFSLTFF